MEKLEIIAGHGNGVYVPVVIWLYGLVRFHKLGDLLSWEFFKSYSAEGDTIAMYKQNGYFTSVWLPWLHTSEGTVVKQFVQWSVTTTRAHTTTKLEHM